MRQHKKLAFSIAILALLLVVVVVVYNDRKSVTTKNTPRQSTPSPLVTDNQDVPKTSTVAENLTVPWDLAFLPDGDLLITERGGKIKRLYLTSDQNVQDIFTVPDVLQTGESGLHGIAVHPNFADNKFVYLYYTFESSGGNTQNRVVRYNYDGNTFVDRTVIVDNIPGALFHDGGRVRFGPDGYLYVTTGDAQVPSLAQDRESLAGKLLRITDAGDAAPGNPFDSPVYSFGHRNPQGITWDENGNLWETEHGNQATDEVNLIKPGNNYGWPVITGEQTRAGMISPVVQSGNTTWAPSSVVHHKGSLYFGGLRGQILFEAVLDSNNSIKEIISHFEGEFGRIRGVTKGPDDMLYISTSNRDGRGSPSTGDDKIIRINMDKLLLSNTKRSL